MLISFPAFLGIFVVERRKKSLYLATALYFAADRVDSACRTAVEAQSPWYWSCGPSPPSSPPREAGLFLWRPLAWWSVVIGDVIQTLGEDPQDSTLSDYTFAPIDFVRLQGGSLDVTAVAVKYERRLAPHALSYLWNELQDAFVPRDIQDYVRGRRLSYDVTVLLNPVAFSRGRGTAGSYLAELYLLGGVTGVVVLSLLIGGGLHLLYSLSRNALSLFVVAMIMPVVILMPRGQLLDWVSDLLKTAISVAMLWFGWLIYRTLLWLRQAPAPLRRLVQKSSPAEVCCSLPEVLPGHENLATRIGENNGFSHRSHHGPGH